MGLQIKISHEEDVKSFVLYDCTGDYNADNKGGYKGPNPNSSLIIESYFEIKGPSDEDYIHKVDVTGSIPNKENIGVEILPSMIGQTDYIPSGKYNFKLTHVFQRQDLTTFTVSGFGVAVMINDISCCVSKLKYDPSKNILTDLRQKKILELKTLFLGVREQIDSGHYDTANTTIDYLKTQCKCEGC